MKPAVEGASRRVGRLRGLLRRPGVERSHPRRQARAGGCGARRGRGGQAGECTLMTCVVACVADGRVASVHCSGQRRHAPTPRRVLTLCLLLSSFLLGAPLILQPFERGAYDAEGLASTCAGCARPAVANRRAVRPTRAPGGPAAQSAADGVYTAHAALDSPVGLSNNPICRCCSVSYNASINWRWISYGACGNAATTPCGSSSISKCDGMITTSHG
jgi:hypothetical protein